MASGIHHITLITRRVQTNVDFYVGFLGLRLAKRTGGLEDAEQLHLVYGDRIGSPGSLITFLVWEDGSPGRIGLGQVAEVALSVDPASIGFWVTRSLQFGLKSIGPTQEFGEPVLRLTDPDGVVLKIVGSALGANAPSHHTHGIEPEHAIRRIRGATIYSAVAEQTSVFLQNYFGYRPLKQAGAVQRLVSESGDVVDVREASGFWPGAPGAGVVDHIAFRTPDLESLVEAERKLASLNSSLTNVHDRKYFVSLYVREPGEALFELATDGPGMTVDESIETLGSVLFVPPSNVDQADAIRTRLPQFSMPGEDRIQYLELPFVHRFHVPSDPDGTTLVLMHGTGGNEADLMPFAARLMPRATLLGVRGRSVEEGRVALVPPVLGHHVRSSRHTGGGSSLCRLHGRCDRRISACPRETSVPRIFQRSELPGSDHAPPSTLRPVRDPASTIHGSRVATGGRSVRLLGIDDRGAR
ncbi:phospholipase/carboxylesterase [Bradyrhizobium sp. LB5.2]